MKKIFLLLGIISMTLLIGCESDWYPIYEDWLCAINVGGSNLDYIRNTYSHLVLSPDRETLIEYNEKQFYSVNLNDLTSKTLLLDLSNSKANISQPYLSNNSIVFKLGQDIYSYNLDVGDTTKLRTSDGSSIIWSLTISKDGEKVAYSTKSDLLSTIGIINVNSRDNHIIYEIENQGSSESYISSIRIIGNNQKLLFVMSDNNYSGFAKGIYSLNINGSDLQTIITNVYPNYLTVSLNENYALFIYDYYLQKVNVDGTNHVLLQEVLNRYFHPSITPNCEKILYENDNYPYIMTSDGTGNYRLVDKKIGDIDPYYKMSYFLSETKILITLEKQIN